MFYFYILSFFWFIRTFKSLLFWIYLWQIKEYHIGRFLDHFRTEKGKKLLLNKLLFLKILLFFGFLLCYFYLPWYFLPWPFFIPGLHPLPVPSGYEGLLIVFSFLGAIFLLFLYFGESYLGIKNFFQKKLIKPVLTSKTIILTGGAFLIKILFLVFLILYNPFLDFYGLWFVLWLLAFDIAFPFIISGWVLLMEPISVLLRRRFIGLACKKRKSFQDLQVIGITGSYGKTSTKEFLFEILSQKYRVLKTSGHQNSEIGISQCILQELKPKHEIFICEMGAYNKGGIKLLCDIVKPKIGIITGVNEQHLALFGSMENLLSAEGGKELIESLPKDGIAFFNAKNRYCRELYKRSSAPFKELSSFLYGKNASFSGEENILGAMAVAKELGMSEQEISQRVKKIKNKFPGIEIKKGINGLNIIDATYSANPTGVMAHLDYLKKWSGRKIIIMPCLIELGPASKRIHYKIGEKIGEICDLAIITTKDRFNEIKQGAVNPVRKDGFSNGVKQGMSEKNILFLEDPQLIKQKIKESLAVFDTAKLGGTRYRQTSGSVVLLEGRIPKQIINIAERG